MKALGVPTEEVNAIVENKRKEVLNLRGFDREEEEVELLQLGISPKSLNATETSVVEGTNLAYNEDKERSASTTEAAAARRKAAEQKSPFVAKVIQEICPGSADDEPCLSPDEIKRLADAEFEFETEIIDIPTNGASPMSNKTLALANDSFAIEDE